MFDRTKFIVVHGFKDWCPSLSEFMQMLGEVQIGANQDCEVTIGGERKTMKEWQKDMFVSHKIFGLVDELLGFDKGEDD